MDRASLTRYVRRNGQSDFVTIDALMCSSEGEMKTFDLIECAEFLKIDRTTLLKLAGKGEIPGAKIGRAWVFLEDDVVAYLRRQINEQTVARQRRAVDPEAANSEAARAFVRQFVRPDRQRPGRRARPLPILPDMPPLTKKGCE